MNKISLHELKDMARSMDFSIDLLEQEHIPMVTSGKISKEDYLLDQLRVLIQAIEDTTENLIQG
jgi:hypothetical protein